MHLALAPAQAAILWLSPFAAFGGAIHSSAAVTPILPPHRQDTG
jgi:hypothetical protein